MIVLHCFNLPYDEISLHLAYYALMGVTHILISPPCLTADIPDWFGRYQPLHYFIIAGPLGNKQQLQNLCKAASLKNISIVADLVLNHMAGIRHNNNSLNFCELKTLQSHSQWKEIQNQYKTLPDDLQQTFPMYTILHPLVKRNFLFTSRDFHINPKITNWDDSHAVMYGTLGTLPDLNQDSANVFTMQSRYMDFLVDIGITSIRLDAVKHMPPLYVSAIIKSFQNSLTTRNLLNKSCFVLCEHIPNSSFLKEVMPYIDAFNAKITDKNKDGCDDTKFDISGITLNIKFYDFPLMNKFASYILTPDVFIPDEKSIHHYNEPNIMRMIDNKNEQNCFTSSQSMPFICNHDIVHNTCFANWYISKSEDKKMAYILLMFLTNRDDLYIFNDNLGGSAYKDEIYMNQDLIKLLTFRKSLTHRSIYTTIKNIDNTIYVGRINRNAFFILNNSPSYPFVFRTEKLKNTLQATQFKNIFDNTTLNLLTDATFNIPPTASYLFVSV